MKILFASVEVSPWAKVGGLADVAGSLPAALKALGHDVRILMPGYGMATAGAAQTQKGLPVPVNPHWAPLMNVWERDLNGVPVWLVDTPGMFEKVTRSEELYNFGRDAYLFFAQAALTLCEAEGWIPDVVHANDWHTGFMPVMLREKGGKEWVETASVYTIHNLQYQGGFGADTVEAAGLPKETFDAERLECWGGVNFLKSACVYADQVNTVSPTYAMEITTEEYGVGLWGLMQGLAKTGRLRGILNGIDYDFFNPETDPAIEKHFSAESPVAKAECRKALQQEFGLSTDHNGPVFGIVSRLSDQKGFDLIIRQAYGMLSLGAQFIALGTGDPWAAEQLKKLELEWPDRVRFIERYDAPLAQRIYAGSDIFLMPSRFEPCGLGQMIACRYGTIPIARMTGGLADTIVEGVNGFTFTEHSPRELFNTVSRACEAFQNKAEWQKLIQRAMQTDFSWNHQAPNYVTMYDDALRSRKAAQVISG